ncbi:MAG TPA: methyltransferase domain-containing protein [Mycobacterium sp.]
MSDHDRARWDRRYTDRDAVSDDEVCLPPVFEPFADAFPTNGRALDLACGRGEAAAWLARRGLQVSGYDVSPVAVARARTLAERCGVVAQCRFEVIDLDDGLPAGPPVDVLMCNRFRDARLDQPIIERLARGGLLAISVLSEVGASPGPFRVKAGELQRAFGELDVIAAHEADGEAWLLARRPRQ